MNDISGMAADRQFLKSLIAEGYKLPDGIDTYEFCLKLIPNLGSPDPELRDDLSATILDSLVSDPVRISGEQAGQVISLLLDDSHLFQDIGEEGTDSVFLRSFSSLISSSILYRDSLNPSIGNDLVRDSIERLLKYSKMERDFRGYVKDKGWAHSVAHLSDALYASAGHPAVGPGLLTRILETTASLSRQDHPMSSGESERLAYASCKAISTLNDPQAALDWIDAYSAFEGERNSPYAKYNSTNFLRSLYFDLKWEESDQRFLEAIDKKVRQLDPLYRNSEDQ